MTARTRGKVSWKSKRIGARVRSLRIRQQLKTREVAAELGWSTSRLKAIEDGEEEITAGALGEIINVLGGSFDWFERNLNHDEKEERRFT